MISLVYTFMSFSYYYFHTPYYKDYISDEIWYVDSSRNLLYKMGLQPRSLYPYTATIFLRPEADVDEFLRWIAQNTSGVYVVTTLSKIKAVYIVLKDRSEVSIIAQNPDVKYVREGYIYGDAGDIDIYYNLEHPPLGKYFIMFFIYLFGDNPFIWRLPSYILGFLKVFLLGVFVYKITREPFFGILGSLIQLLDPMNIYMDGLAMLEPYVSFFTILAAISLVIGYETLGGVFIGLAGASKMNGFFIILPALMISSSKRFWRTFINLILIPLIIFLLINIPIIGLFGYKEWWDRSIVGALSWHLSTKTKPGEGPPISAPWDWFLGVNPFYVTVNPDTPIRGNIMIYLGVILLSIILLKFVSKYKEIVDMTILSYGTWLGYVIIWIAGNHSEYSFYMAQISPLFDSLFVLLIYVFYKEYENIINFYINLPRSIISVIKRYLMSQRSS